MTSRSDACCCCTLQTGVKTVAIFHIVGTIIGIMFVLLGMTAVAQEMKSNYSSDEDGAFMAILIVLLIAFVAYLAVCIVLLIGANQRHYGKCKLWFVVTIVLLCSVSLRMGRLLYQAQQVGSQEGAGSAFPILIGMLANIGFTGWQLWAVNAFMDEIKNGDTSGDGFNHFKLKEEA